MAIAAIEKKMLFLLPSCNSSDELFKHREIKCLVLESAIQKP